jgi:hypothetical protein
VPEFPNPQGRQQESLGTGQSSGSGHGRCRIGLGLAVTTFTISATIARPRFRLRFLDVTRGGLAYRHMIAAIHKVPHIPSSFQTSYCNERG